MNKSIYKPFSEISDYLGLMPKEESKKRKTENLIRTIEEMNYRMNIPSYFKDARLVPANLPFIQSIL